VASEVDIANRALLKLGAGTILSLDDDDPKAVALKISYPLVRDAELRRRRWKFSLSRRSLPASNTAPEFGFARAFPLPGECLRVIQVGEYDLGPNLSDYRTGSSELFSIEGRQILTNLPAPLKVRLIEQVTDTALYDACFVETLASRLAYETCERITQDAQKKRDALLDYRVSIREARRADALETAPNEPADDTWIMARVS
jgi:hypothetical protein